MKIKQPWSNKSFSEQILIIGIILSIMITFGVISCSSPSESNPPYNENQAPVIIRVEKIPNDRLAVRDTAIFTCYAEDPEGERLTYQWTIPDWWETFAGFYIYSGQTVKFFADSALVQNGTARAIPFFVEIYDSWWFKTTYWDSITVIPRDWVNAPPRIVDLYASSDRVAPLDTTEITAVIEDPDDGIHTLSFEWDYDGGYNLASSVTHMTWKAPHIPMTYTITLIVEDSYRNVTTKSIEIRVDN